MFTYDIFAWQNFHLQFWIVRQTVLTTVISGSVSEAVQLFLWLNHSVWRPVDQGQLIFIVHWDFSRFSESFSYIFFCRWWNIQSFSNVMLRKIIHKLFHNSYSFFFFRLVNLCPSLLMRNSASLRCSFYTQSHYWLLSINLISCKIR